MSQTTLSQLRALATENIYSSEVNTWDYQVTTENSWYYDNNQHGLPLSVGIYEAFVSTFTYTTYGLPWAFTETVNEVRVPIPGAPYYKERYVLFLLDGRYFIWYDNPEATEWERSRAEVPEIFVDPFLGIPIPVSTSIGVAHFNNEATVPTLVNFLATLFL